MNAKLMGLKVRGTGTEDFHAGIITTAWLSIEVTSTGMYLSIDSLCPQEIDTIMGALALAMPPAKASEGD